VCMWIIQYTVHGTYTGKWRVYLYILPVNAGQPSLIAGYDEPRLNTVQGEGEYVLPVHAGQPSLIAGNNELRLYTVQGEREYVLPVHAGQPS
jgi:hypothetical protein